MVGRRNRKLFLKSTEVQYEMMKKFWRGTVVVAAWQCECTFSHWINCALKMVKIVNFVMYTNYYKSTTPQNKWKDTMWIIWMYQAIAKWVHSEAKRFITSTILSETESKMRAHEKFFNKTDRMGEDSARVLWGEIEIWWNLKNKLKTLRLKYIKDNNKCVIQYQVIRLNIIEFTLPLVKTHTWGWRMAKGWHK